MDSSAGWVVQDARYFFVHTMKTAGSSFVTMIQRDVYSADQMYPNALDENPNIAVTAFEYIRALPEERKQKTKFFVGHLPYSARKIFGEDLYTITFLRDPVARTISMLKHFKQRVSHYADLDIAELFSRRRAFEAFVKDFQVRVFALDPLPERGSLLQPYRIDERGFDRALENLRRVDFVGLVEDFETSARMLETFTGWKFSKIDHVNVGRDYEVRDDLAERIRASIPQEMRFYEEAKALYEQRKIAWLASRPRVAEP